MSGPTRPVVVAETDIDNAADEPMTARQTAELKDLCAEMDEEFDRSLNRDQASKRIAALKEIRAR